MRRILPLLLCLLLLAGCTAQPAQSTPSSSSSAPLPISKARASVTSGERQFQTPAGDVSLATIHTSKGDIQVALYADVAPLAVENFTALAREGYYDGSSFHRVVEDFIIQGGSCPEEGAADRSAFGEPFAGEFSDEVHHYAGALCMAAADNEPDTLQSQFYIVAAPQANLDEAALEKMRAAGMREEVIDAYRQAGGLPYLDYGDTVFGHVYSGMDLVDSIAAAPAEEGVPKKPVVIESITIDGIAFSTG